MRTPCKGRVKPERPKKGTQILIFDISDLLETVIKNITKIGSCIDTVDIVFTSMAVFVVTGVG